MSLRILRDGDADVSLLAGERVGVVGFGNQGAAQARCLRDEGLAVRVFVPPGGPSAARAREEGFGLGAFPDLADCSVVAVLAPDEVQPGILVDLVRPHAQPGALLVFAHGFTLRSAKEAPREDLDVALVCPLGPGALLRERYVAGSGLAGLFAVVRDATGTARSRALAYAAHLRLTRAGLLPTTLDEEVTSDLFAEQVVLVGGVVELMRAAWETLVEGGVCEEVAYYACVQELKQMLDVVHREGPAGMRRRISTTAQYGGLTRGPRVIGEESRAAMRAILAEIRSGAFARELDREGAVDWPGLQRLLAAEAAHPIEEAGARVRKELQG